MDTNLVCKLNSLMANLSISKDLIDRIEVAQVNDEVLHGFLISS